MMAWVTGDRESVCREVYAIRERKSCYESGQAVTFLFGDYYCCKNVTDEELVSYGSSAFWRMNRGFCGRGGCETCSRDQDCVVFGGGEDVFCCPHGYITDEEMALRHNARPTEPLRPHEEHDHRGHIEDHDHDNHHIHGNDDSSEEVTDDNIRLKDDGAVDNGFREVVRQPTPRIDPPLDPRRQEEENRKKVKLPPIIPPSPATTLRSRNTTRTSIATSSTTRSTSTTRVPEIHPRHDIPSRIYAPRNSRDEELEEILEHDHHMHDHWVILVNIALKHLKWISFRFAAIDHIRIDLACFQLLYTLWTDGKIWDVFICIFEEDFKSVVKSVTEEEVPVIKETLQEAHLTRVYSMNWKVRWERWESRELDTRIRFWITFFDRKK